MQQRQPIWTDRRRPASTAFHFSPFTGVEPTCPVLKTSPRSTPSSTATASRSVSSWPFNIDICEGLLSACAAELKKLGVAAGDITIATVPGALEIPLVLQTMAQSGDFDALVALGAVIRGETYHFEVVSNDARRAVMGAARHRRADRQWHPTCRRRRSGAGPACRSRRGLRQAAVEMATCCAPSPNKEA